MSPVVCVTVSAAVIAKATSSSFLCVEVDSEMCVLAGESGLKAIRVQQGGSVHSLLTIHSFHPLGCDEPGKLLARHIWSEKCQFGLCRK